MKSNSISKFYNLKWEIKDNTKYKWSTCGRLFNVKTGRDIKKTVVGYSVGYYIDGKFITLVNLRNRIQKIKNQSTPF